MVEKTERFEMRLSQEVFDQVDEWRKDQDDNPSRAEAVRRLIENSLSKSPSITGGEKLILIMLCDLFKKLKIDSDIEPGFIEDVIYGGHYWALRWKYQGLFHGYADTNKDVTEVCDILDMWTFIERGYNKLSKKDQDFLEQELSPFGKNIQFPGFDGNNEAEQLGIARFLIEKMDRFGHFKNRVHDLNSHSPSLDGYKKMLNIFLPMRSNLIGIELDAKQLIQIMNSKYK